jgi:hypothetical protein
MGTSYGWSAILLFISISRSALALGSHCVAGKPDANAFRLIAGVVHSGQLSSERVSADCRRDAIRSRQFIHR